MPNQGYTISGYGDFIAKLRAFVAANPHKQVLYIGGDTHTPRVDHPLTDIYPSPTQLTPAGIPYPNFTRLEVYAHRGIHQLVQGNRQPEWYARHPYAECPERVIAQLLFWRALIQRPAATIVPPTGLPNEQKKPQEQVTHRAPRITSAYFP